MDIRRCVRATRSLLLSTDGLDLFKIVKYTAAGQAGTVVHTDAAAFSYVLTLSSPDCYDGGGVRATHSRAPIAH
jgi:hypothetical protein